MADQPDLLDLQSCVREDNGDISFTMSNYLNESMKIVSMMRTHHMLTDVVIVVQYQKFPAHRLILAASSPYFRAMFTGGLREADMSAIEIAGVSARSLQKILDFMYDGTIRVSESTVCALLEAATMLQVSELVTVCCHFLEQQIEPSNVIGIYMFAEQRGCNRLRDKAMSYIEQHFEQVSSEEEFFLLTEIQLVKLISRDTLNVLEETVVYNAVVEWVKYDEERRRGAMENVLQAVRCQYLPPSFLEEQVNNCDLVKKSPQCTSYLTDIFNDLTLHKMPWEKARKPNTHKIIYLVGGFLKRSLDTVEAYNVDEDVWIPLAKMSLPRSGIGAAFLKGFLYTVGGRCFTPENRILSANGLDATVDTDWLERYNPGLNEWTPCSLMSVARVRLGVAVLDGLLYAVGGCALDKYHNSVARYDPYTDHWEDVCPMHHFRMGLAVAVHNRLLYAIGGFDGKSRLDSVECYHPENDAWTLLPPMEFARSGHGAAVLGNYLYVVGGFSGKCQLDVVERFDMDTHEWERVQNLNTARSALTLTEVDGKMYAIGGYDGTNFLDSVEIYDPVFDQWTEGSPMTKPRSGHAAAASYHRCMIPSNSHEVGSDLPTAIAYCPAARPEKCEGNEAYASKGEGDVAGAVGEGDVAGAVGEGDVAGAVGEGDVAGAVGEGDVAGAVGLQI